MIVLSKLRVLVVDDSAFFRRLLVTIINACGDMEVVATAGDGSEAVRKARELRPDVITMDVAMPQMSGLAALKEIMAERPTPIIMVSSLTVEGANETLQALESGAVDVVAKPKGALGMRELADLLPLKLRAAASSRLTRQRTLSDRRTHSGRPWDYELVVVGCSTGGPSALQRIIPALPADFPAPVVVAQHIPIGFTGPMAQRLNQQSQVQVVEAVHGQPLRAGCVYIAPSGSHTAIKREKNRAEISILPPKVTSSPFLPSVNVLFSSALPFAPHVLAIVLTGMGQDGLLGAKELHRAGAEIVAESEETSVVYGMPRVVIEAGLTERVLSLGEIVAFLASPISR
ncbi:MAG: Chemotaxis response regulator protein-glutamate methylesterase [Firmicutes bacterium]|nr:Chemotaxis response regulator protein-glutamate methylesterase [candidate division NPL-UPA2 bacterium]